MSQDGVPQGHYSSSNDEGAHLSENSQVVSSMDVRHSEPFTVSQQVERPLTTRAISDVIRPSPRLASSGADVYTPEGPQREGKRSPRKDVPAGSTGYRLDNQAAAIGYSDEQSSVEKRPHQIMTGSKSAFYLPERKPKILDERDEKKLREITAIIHHGSAKRKPREETPRQDTIINEGARESSQNYLAEQFRTLNLIPPDGVGYHEKDNQETFPDLPCGGSIKPRTSTPYANVVEMPSQRGKKAGTAVGRERGTTLPVGNHPSAFRPYRKQDHLELPGTQSPSDLMSFPECPTLGQHQPERSRHQAGAPGPASREGKQSLRSCRMKLSL